jgi:tetratricopeptide (TPR) repeat protein
MTLENIERLKEKINKEPNSKLFIPLAEEYKKAGMFDEAIDVLTKGLERQPGYMSARVSLGKIYLDKGMLSEASEEFEKVVKAIPDNLYAQKKLAEIYRDLGERDKAIEAFKKVQALNPADEEVAKSLADLEKKITVHTDVTKIVKAMLKEEKPPEKPVSEEEKIVEELAEAPLEAGEEIQEAVETTEAFPVDLEELLVPQEILKEPDIVVEEKVVEKPPLSIGDADSRIAQGRYEEAIDIYKRLLSINPGDVHVLQRIEELKALLKILGKDKGDLTARFNKFLEGIRKKRDEFFRNP